MENSQAKSIIVSTNETTQQMFKRFMLRTQAWESCLKKKHAEYLKQSVGDMSRGAKEIREVQLFFQRFPQKRLREIAVMPEEKKRKYLFLLQPYHVRSDFVGFLSHYFQLEITNISPPQLIYKTKNNQEREVNILLDMYKLKKTIETINTLEKAIQKNSFPSRFSAEEQGNILVGLKAAFKLFFQRCILPQYQQELYKNISAKYVSPKTILARYEKGLSYIYPHVLEKFDHRNHLFLIYFAEGMKAKIKNNFVEYKFNYLDFECLKQEFLTNWLCQLNAEGAKEKVYQLVNYNGVLLSKLVAENPHKEKDYLSQMPINQFNDVAAAVNENLDPKQKTSITPLSENFGESARVIQVFTQAVELVKDSIEKLKSFVADKSKKSTTPSPTLANSSPPKVEKPNTDPVPEEKIPPKKLGFTITRLKKEEIDFPYYIPENIEYTKKLNLLRARMGGEPYKTFHQQVSKILNNSSENVMIKRRTPKHDWVLPYLIEEVAEEGTKNHLVLLGAEVSSKSLGMGYRSGSSQDQYKFNCYYVYGSEEETSSLGTSNSQRKARGKAFYCYESFSPEVITLLWKLLPHIYKKEFPN